MSTVAVVLAGGESRRMGRDKALLEWHGRPLLEHVLGRLRGAFEKLVVVGGRIEWVRLPDVLWIPDEEPGAGAAAAILTALRHLQQPCFVCACDMPFVHAEMGRWLAEKASGATAHVPRWQGQAQPLHAAWFPGATPFLHESLQMGESALWRILQRMGEAGTLQWVDEEAVRRFDAEGRCFVNLNTPQEWQAWQNSAT
ncbi:MAG: molybdenum cofactor guanylyltransferase [Armatimonadota bacterium]|nr:molybdenum cofactor guanylyltransferase [bacterium]MDW8320312.1 molybdenum cofactor guanylyltransferase [Armatimonadota bacterium]